MKNILIIFFLSIFISNIQAQNDVKKVIETVSKSKIEGHIYFLASDELKGRQTGTAENKIAAQYLANMLRSYGVKPIPQTRSYLQPVALKKTSAASKTILKYGSVELNEIFNINSASIDYKGNAVFVNYGSEEDYKNIDVKGKYVISIVGPTENNNLGAGLNLAENKSLLAKKNGALGLIEVCNLSDGFTKSKEQKIELKIKGIENSTIYSQNVVGMVEGTDPKLKNEYIIYSAHYDHVGIGKAVKNDSIYNGARDNAVGTVTVLSAAENIAKYPTKRSALFILFTGEEKGLLGSEWYVEHPVVPLKQMVYCFNSDNGGYNDTSKATIIGLNRTTAKDDIIKAAAQFKLEAIDDPAPEQGLFDRSDNVNFALKGIPAPTFSLGFTSFNEEITKYYHQVTDNPDSVDYDYLYKFFQSYVLACRNIANNPKTPFWIEGDKYYEAGKKLYQD